jgi:hypothetical protein
MLDPIVGRWWMPDPLAEKAYHLTPYRYAFNNPVRYIDSDGLFELDNAHQYQRLSHYLQNTITGILSNEHIMKNLRSYGRLTDEQISNHFEWEKGPKIMVVDKLKGSKGLPVNGHFDGKNSPNVLFLDKDLVMQLENAFRKDADAALLFVISTLLHEYVHYGEYKDYGFIHDNDYGEGFEKYTYGQIIGSKEIARKVLQDWNKREDERRQNEEIYEHKMTWGEVEMWLNRALMRNPNIKVSIN